MGIWIRKRDLRDIYISENVKVTIDLEDVKKEIANQFYNNEVKV